MKNLNTLGINLTLCKKCNKPKNMIGIYDPIEFCRCGRPSIYNDMLLRRAYEYMELEMPHTGKDGITEVFHSIEGLTSWLGIARSTLYKWVKDINKEEFSDIVERVLTMQVISLINNGIVGKFNASIVKLILSKHGYTDKTNNYIN